MCWYSPPHTAVAMTYSQSAFGDMEWWSFLQQYPTRALLLAHAWLAVYRPTAALRAALAPHESALVAATEV